VLAKDISLTVVDVGVAGGPFLGKNVVKSLSNKLPNGTRNFCVESAMTSRETDQCMQMGRDSLIRIVEENACKVVALGECGIGNTTAASALVAALTRRPIEDLCGGGAYTSRTADEAVIKKKVAIVRKALKNHEGVSSSEPAKVLAKLGGAEIAALSGAILEAGNRSIPILVDGFIVTAAALVAACMDPSVCRVLFLATKSAEKGQLAAIEEIQAISQRHNLPVLSQPALSMGLRMGEGTGALLAVPILKSAASMVTNMATIQEILRVQ
jgi:nicotinate-nucleotide--dimethylbenzimidazole phosphoribosyltransferase